MKILIASDIHGRYKRMEHLLEVINKEHPQKIILLGDYLYNGPRNGVPDDYDPVKVYEMLNLLKDYIVGIRGNCDSRVDSMLLKFPLEDFRSLDLNGKHCELTHGDLVDFNNMPVHKGDIFMFGHTHLFMLENMKGVIACNPGSVSFPKNGNPATYMIFDDKGLYLKDFFKGNVIKTLLFTTQLTSTK